MAAARLPLRKQVGLLLVSSFDGTRAPAYLRRRLRAGETSGVVVFRKNIASPGQLVALARSLQASAGRRALVATDQEGGQVRNLRFAGPVPAAPSQGSPGRVRTLSASAGRKLRRHGVNVNLAPVADVAGPGSVMRSRAFGSSPGPVADRVRASVRGYRAGRVASTVKHFPGFGAARRNTDQTPVTIFRRRSTILRVDLAPFRAAVREGAPLVMASHALYPGLDRRRIASQSRPILTALLRRRLRYRGAIITDSMEAQAVVRRSSVAVAAERAVAAGADLVLMTGSASWKLVYPRLLRTARRSPAFRRRVRESAARVLELRRKLGLRGVS